MNEIETLQNHIKKLEAENQQLKKDLEHARSYKHTIEEDIKRGIERPQAFASYWSIIAFEELRKTLHALWMTRAYNGFNTTYNLTSYHTYMIEHPYGNFLLQRPKLERNPGRIRREQLRELRN